MLLNFAYSVAVFQAPPKSYDSEVVTVKSVKDIEVDFGFGYLPIAGWALEEEAADGYLATGKM